MESRTSLTVDGAGAMDARFGYVVNHDLAGYHIANHADVANIDAVWLRKRGPRSPSPAA